MMRIMSIICLVIIIHPKCFNYFYTYYPLVHATTYERATIQFVVAKVRIETLPHGRAWV